MDEQGVKFEYEENKSANMIVKYMANDFYKTLTNAMRDYVVNSMGKESADKESHNVWTLMKCFWLSFKYVSQISDKDIVEMDGSISHYDFETRKAVFNKDEDGDEIIGLLSKPFENSDQAFCALDKLFEKAAKAGIFVEFKAIMGDYDPESYVDDK